MIEGADVLGLLCLITGTVSAASLLVRARLRAERAAAMESDNIARARAADRKVNGGIYPIQLFSTMCAIVTGISALFASGFRGEPALLVAATAAVMVVASVLAAVRLNAVTGGFRARFSSALRVKMKRRGVVRR